MQAVFRCNATAMDSYMSSLATIGKVFLHCPVIGIYGYVYRLTRYIYGTSGNNRMVQNYFIDFLQPDSITSAKITYYVFIKERVKSCTQPSVPGGILHIALQW
jgi:hypothetical protein